MSKRLLIVLVALFAFSVGFSNPSSGCYNCISSDCSNPQNTGCVVYGNCPTITYKPTVNYCGTPSYAITCSSSSLDKPSNDGSFGSNGFVYDTNKPYYCTNYNATGTYAWKTCYSNAPDTNWVSKNLACNSGGQTLTYATQHN